MQYLVFARPAQKDTKWQLCTAFGDRLTKVKALNGGKVAEEVVSTLTQ